MIPEILLKSRMLKKGYSAEKQGVKVDRQGNG